MKYFLRFLPLLALTALPFITHADTGFTPLTSIPALQIADNAQGLSSFLNQLYILCVGATAVLAVVQIIYAGVRWSTSGGSHSGIEDARSRIQNSILGLILVLSPTIVFGIINPDILSLKIASLDKLKPATVAQPTASSPIPNDPCPQGNGQKCSDILIPKDKPFVFIFDQIKTESGAKCSMIYHAEFSDQQSCQTKLDATMATYGDNNFDESGVVYEALCSDLGGILTPTTGREAFCPDSPQSYK